MNHSPFSRLFTHLTTFFSKPFLVFKRNKDGFGLSIRQRAYLATATAFLLAAPISLIAVYRTQAVSDYAKSAKQYDAFAESVTQIHLQTKEIYVQLWKLVATSEVERALELQHSLESLLSAFHTLISTHKNNLSISFQTSLVPLAEHVEILLQRLMFSNQFANYTSQEETVYELRSLIFQLSENIKKWDMHFKKNSILKHEKALFLLSNSGRDQLVLFTFLVLLGLLFLFFIPSWIIAPIRRLRLIERRIEEGELRNLIVYGDDEIASVTRTIKKALIKKENLELKKTAKIFEVRNVLRGIISNINEAIMVIDQNDKITFVNESAALLFDLEQHYLEGSVLTEHVFSPELMHYIGRAQIGDVPDKDVLVSLELPDGRRIRPELRLGSVHDREGNISRVVLVFQTSQQPKESVNG